MQQRLGDACEIVYGKAGNVSSFRQDQRLNEQGEQVQAGQCRKNEHTQPDPLFVKCREVNDFHHAKDAYLNIVVGNVYHVKFTRSPANFLRENHAKFSLNRMFDFDVSRGGENAWKAGPDGSIEVVRRMMRKNNVLLTRMASEGKGQLFDLQLMKKGSGQAQVKSADPRMSIENFGGYNKLTVAYYCLVEHTDKKKRVRSMESIPLMHRKRFESAPEEYMREQCKLESPKILVPKIRINDVLEYDGFRMRLAGKTGSSIIVQNANPLVLPPEWQAYIKTLSKYLDRCKQAKTDLEITRFDGITAEQNRRLYDTLCQKLHVSPFAAKCKSFSELMEKKETEFVNISVPNQVRILMQSLNEFADTGTWPNWKLLDGPATAGRLSISKNIGSTTDQKHKIKLIRQSITGVFEQKIDLLGDFSK